MSITSRHRKEVACAISEHIMSLKEDEECLEKASPDTDTVVADDSTAGTLTPTSTIAGENDEATCSIVIKVVHMFPTSSSELHVKINRWSTFEKLLRHLQVPDQFPRRLEITHEGRKTDIFESDTPASLNLQDGAELACFNGPYHQLHDLTCFSPAHQRTRITPAIKITVKIMQNSMTIKQTRHVKLYPDIPFKHLINLLQESKTSIRRLEEKDTGRDIFVSDTADSLGLKDGAVILCREGWYGHALLDMTV